MVWQIYRNKAGVYSIEYKLGLEAFMADTHTFTASMHILHYMAKGKIWILKDMETGGKYKMAHPDYLFLIKNTNCYHGMVKGSWRFQMSSRDSFEGLWLVFIADKKPW